MADSGQGKTVSRAVSQLRSLCKKEQRGWAAEGGMQAVRPQDARTHISAPDLEEVGKGVGV